MKVAMLNTVCYGSTGKIMRGVARMVREGGGEARLFYGRGDSRGDTDAIRVTSTASVLMHALFARLFDRNGFYSARATRSLVAQLIAYDPDVIHLHNLHGYWVHLPTLFSYLAVCGKPVIWTFHDCWAFTGHCVYNIASGCERFTDGCHDCPAGRVYPKRLFWDRSPQNYEEKKRLVTAVPNLTVVTPSDWLAGLVRRSFLRDRDLRVVRNGIDLAVFHPTNSDLRERNGIMQGRTLLLGVAQVWDWRKGLDSFLELRKRLPETVTMALIGLTPTQIKRLPEGILGLPRTKDAMELAAWYSAADVYVDCTHEDNFPTTHIEALACGAPVVTFSAGGSAEMLTKRCGVGVPVDDIDGMLSAIDQAARFCRKDCILRGEEYDETARFAEYLALYGEKSR